VHSCMHVHPVNNELGMISTRLIMILIRLSLLPSVKAAGVQAEIFLNLEFSLQYSDSQARSLATETWTES
jgi:hypothetical protein